MFALSDNPLDPQALRAQLEDPCAGGYASFEGWVRNHNEGRAVARLEYEAYPALALREGERIVREAAERFGVTRAACVHRTGTLAIGDMAVWVGVSAPHRGEAFAACRYIIDEVKHRVPIWKKEYYDDGDSGWVRCEHCAAHDEALPISEDAFYARQLMLPEIGALGQARMRDARVLVVGAGGLGCAALQHLVSAGIGTVGICDADMLDVSNLHRQTLYGWPDVGKPKAALACERLATMNPFVKLNAHAERFDDASAARLLAGYDMVLDCTDNFEAKFLLNDACVREGKVLVQASIYQYEGQLFVYVPGRAAPCLRCIWPEVPLPGCTGSCAEAGILGAVAGVFGALQAAEALKHLLALPGRLEGHTLFLDLLSYSRRLVRAQRRADCPVCGGDAPRDKASADEQIPLEIDPAALGMQSLAGFTVVDVRDAAEAAARPLEISGIRVVAEPLESILQFHFDAGTRYALCCARGIRSRAMARKLREEGHAGIYSIAGGAQRLLGPAARC